MSYLTLLPLVDAKAYLRIDDGQNEDDAGITAMIKAVFQYLERKTNVIAFSREKTYPLAGSDCLRVYDFPINSVVKGIDEDGADVTLTKGTNYTRTDKTLHTLLEGIDTDAQSVVLSVGYADTADYPSDLLEAGKMILGQLYYNKEAETIEDAIPLSAKMIIDANTRFII